LSRDRPDIVSTATAWNQHTATERGFFQKIQERRVWCTLVPWRVTRKVARLPINAGASGCRGRCRIGIFGSAHE
jgi:hypothetical protein